jgi:predicted O-methyltransferase YrrM
MTRPSYVSRIEGLTKARWFRDWAKSLSFAIFRTMDTAKIHVLPKHYYSPIPDHRWLASNRDAWVGRPDFSGVLAWDLDAQLQWLREECSPYLAEVEGLRAFHRVNQSGVGIGFGPIDSQVLHCVVRSLAPSQIIEIGSGFSTLYMLEAGALNAAEDRTVPQITCIEPNPRPAFSSLDGVTLLRQPCQTLPLSLFRGLGNGDLLFIDSTHSVRVGSDVVRIYTEIVPNLRPGVTVHIHDINLPYTYPRDALSGFWGSQESALLLALLVGNRRLEVLACLSALAYDRERALEALLPDYRPVEHEEGLSTSKRGDLLFPRSIWLRTVDDD